MEINELYTLYRQHPSICTDSRKLQPGDGFFALKGPNFNGNAFARQALDAGAAFVVVDEPAGFSDPRLVHTDDVLGTLQQLAKHHRLQFDIPFLAITGSNGKTTTKELIHEVLSTTMVTYTTVGNLNNHIGVPLTILSVKPDAQVAVIEMGANHQREIAGYCEYAMPTHGLITNVGKAHLEGFGGQEGIRKGKGELFDYLRANRGTAFIMSDYDYLREMSAGIPFVCTYGTRSGDITGETAGGDELLRIRLTHGTGLDVINTQLVGNYNLPNVLAAVATGKYFGVAEEKIREALENYRPSNSRSQLVEAGTNKIILDAYNANPSSMKAAIDNFSKMPGDKVILLGAMMELGPESIAEHHAVVELLQQYAWKSVVLVGGDFAQIKHPYRQLSNSLEARDWFREQHLEHTRVLIKGSRSMKMERVVEGSL